MKSSKFDIVELIEKKLGKVLKDEDVLVVSSKSITISEGRVVALRGVRVGVKVGELSVKVRDFP